MFAVGEGSVIGAYRLERRLGAGSTSEVFLAVHTEIQRRVAIKVLAPQLSIDAEIFGRFVEEARIVNAVDNEHIVQIYDVVRSDEPRIVAFVMELVLGPSLKAIRPHQLSPEQSTGVALQLASAVGAAHAAGIIHRDLKPENLLFTDDPRGQPASVIPRLKVIDFGIAKQLGGPARTKVGQMLGTPAYMAPEQIVGNPPSSAASDVYAVGEICFEMWTGGRAFPQSTTNECVRAKLRGEPVVLQNSSLPSSAHDLARRLVERTLAHDPKDRPPLEEVREALREIAGVVAAGGLAGSIRDEDTARTTPPSIPAAQTEAMTIDAPPARGRRRGHIPLQPTAPSSSAAEPPTEEGLATIAGDLGAGHVGHEDATDEVLPIIEEASAPVVSNVPIAIVASDTVMQVPPRPKKQPGSYESLAVLLEHASAPTAPRAATPLVTAMPMAELSSRPNPPISGAPLVPPPSSSARTWAIAAVLLVVAIGLLTIVIATRP